MSTGKDTVKHAAIFSMAAVMGRIISFLMLPIYAHMLRGSGYAIIGMLDVGLGLLASLLAYGTRGSIVRIYHDETEPERKKQVVSTGTILILSLSSMITVPLLLFAGQISSLLLDDAGLKSLVYMALISFTLDMTGQGASAWLLIKKRSALFAGINLVRLFVGLSLNIWLIVIQGMGVKGYFLSALFTNVVSTGLYLVFSVHGCGWRFDRAIAGKILHFLLPLVPGAMAQFLAQQAERIIVRYRISLDTVGILEMGYKFPMLLVQLITIPFMQAWDTRRFEMADREEAPRVIGEMFTYYFFLMAAAGLIMAVVVKPFLFLVTPPEFHLSYRIARIEIVTLILQGSYFHLSFGILYAKQTGVIARIRGWTSALKVIMSWIFITTLGIYGAAISAVITALLSVLIIFPLSQRRYRMILEWKKIGMIVVFSLSMFLLLDHVDVSGTVFALSITGRFLPWLQGVLSSTFLGTWKDGKLIVLIAENRLVIVDIIIKGLISTSVLLLLPMIHESTRLKIKFLSGKLVRR